MRYEAAAGNQRRTINGNMQEQINPQGKEVAMPGKTGTGPSETERRPGYCAGCTPLESVGPALYPEKTPAQIQKRIS